MAARRLVLDAHTATRDGKMAFEVKIGDIFGNVKHGFIMHGCNAQGVMGSGVANIVRLEYHKAYEVYALQYPNYILGEVIPVEVADNLVIVNAITQDDYGTHKVQVDYDAVEQACRGVKHLANSGMIESTDIHFPFIGAGLAGGDQVKLLEIFERQFAPSWFEGSENPEDNDATLWVLEKLK